MATNDENRAASLAELGPCKKCHRAKYDHHSPYEYAALLADQAAGCDGFFEPMTKKEHFAYLNEDRASLMNKRDAAVKSYDAKKIEALQVVCPHAHQRGVEPLSGYTMNARFCDDCEKQLR